MFRHTLFVAVLSCTALAQPPDNLGTPPPSPPQAPVTPDPLPQAAAPTVTRSESGKSLLIPDDVKKLGTIYYTAPTAAKQVSFLSDGKIRSDGHSSSVIGYAVAGPADSPAALKAGLWAMPVKSLATGNKLKDKHIADDTWLDAAKCPDAIFVLKEVRDIKPHKESAAGKSYSATLVGEMTLHGVTRPLMIPETILAFAAAKEGAALKGDLLAIRCKYTIKFSHYGVSNDYTTRLKTVNDEVAVDQSLILSTVPPEQQPEVKSEGEAK